MTPLTADALATVIENLYKNYEPRTKITSVIVTPDFDQDLYIVDVKFYVIGIDGPQILSTKLERLR
jgi:hypothetical protein